MTKVAAIAFNTFKEAVRNRVLYVLLFFSILIMFAAWVASTLSIDDQGRIVRDLGVFAINVIAVLITVFVGIGLVYNDLDKKTIYTIVSKPISRWQFLLGKYFGLLLTIAVNVLIMTWIFSSVLHLREGLNNIDAGWIYTKTQTEGGEIYVYNGVLAQISYYAYTLIKSLVLGLFHIISLGHDGYEITNGLFATSMLTILEMAIVTSFAVLFSSFSSPTLSAFLTVLVFIIGRMNQDLYLFAQTMANKAGGTDALSGGQSVTYWLSMFAAHISPNLDIFNQRDAIAESAQINFHVMDFGYTVLYSAGIIVLSVLVFNRRNFK